MDKVDNDLVLIADVMPYLVKGKLKQQRLNVKINQRPLANRVIASPGEFSVDIPKELITDGFLELLFELPDAVSQEQLGIAKDPTLFALGFRTMRIEEMEPAFSK